MTRTRGWGAGALLLALFPNYLIAVSSLFMIGAGTRTRGWGSGALLLAALIVAPGGLAAQALADYDYENLSFRGFGLEGGWIFPNNVEPTYTLGGRIDLGFLGPGLRIVPTVLYWSSDLEEGEVAELESRLESLVDSQSPPGTPPASVVLSPIEWRDVVIGLDAQFVWSLPGPVLSYLGSGVSAHILNGKGPAIDGTFVEDLLDSVRAGINVHAGLEYAAHDRFRIYGEGRGEALDDLAYLELRLGGRFFLSPTPSALGAAR